MKFLQTAPTSQTPHLVSNVAGLLFPWSLCFCFPQLATLGKVTSTFFLCTLFPMPGINEPASWGQCLSTAVFSSNYLETEKEVINNPGSQPESLPHETLRALGQKVTFYGGPGWAGVTEQYREKDKGVGSRFSLFFWHLQQGQFLLCKTEKV